MKIKEHIKTIYYRYKNIKNKRMARKLRKKFKLLKKGA